jgi:hypothetical protein
MTVVPHSSYFSLFPWLKIELKGRRFDTIEVIKEESPAVLKTFIEHDFQNEFNIRAAEVVVHTRRRRLLPGRWWPVGPKLVFDQMADPIPEIMEHSLYFVFYKTLKVYISFIVTLYM